MCPICKKPLIRDVVTVQGQEVHGDCWLDALFALWQKEEADELASEQISPGISGA